MSDWQSPNPPHITDPLGTKNKKMEDNNKLVDQFGNPINPKDNNKNNILERLAGISKYVQKHILGIIAILGATAAIMMNLDNIKKFYYSIFPFDNIEIVDMHFENSLLDVKLKNTGTRELMITNVDFEILNKWRYPEPCIQKLFYIFGHKEPSKIYEVNIPYESNYDSIGVFKKTMSQILKKDEFDRVVFQLIPSPLTQQICSYTYKFKMRFYINGDQKIIESPPFLFTFGNLKNTSLNTSLIRFKEYNDNPNSGMIKPYLPYLNEYKTNFVSFEEIFSSDSIYVVKNYTISDSLLREISQDLNDSIIIDLLKQDVKVYNQNFIRLKEKLTK